MEQTFGLQMSLNGRMVMEMDLVIILAEPMETNVLEFLVHLLKIEMDVLTLMEMVILIRMVVGLLPMGRMHILQMSPCGLILMAMAYLIKAEKMIVQIVPALRL